jgi:transcriptional regulator NrdR family protein
MNDALRAKCKHLKSQVLETRRLGPEIYRRRMCQCCFKTFVSMESSPDGLQMPTELRNSEARSKLKNVERKPVLDVWDGIKPLSQVKTDKMVNSVFALGE